MPRVEVGADASKLEQYTMGDLRALLESYLKFEKEAK